MMPNDPYEQTAPWLRKVQTVEISHYEIVKRIIWFFIDDWLDLTALFLVFVLYYFEDEADDALTISRINRARSAIVFQTVGIFAVKYIGNKSIRTARYWMHLVIFCLAVAIFTEPLVRYWQDRHKKSQPKNRLQVQQQQNDSDTESEDELEERLWARERPWRSLSREPAGPSQLSPARRATTRSVSRDLSPKLRPTSRERLHLEPTGSSRQRHLALA